MAIAHPEAIVVLNSTVPVFPHLEGYLREVFHRRVAFDQLSSGRATDFGSHLDTVLMPPGDACMHEKALPRGVKFLTVRGRAFVSPRLSKWRDFGRLERDLDPANRLGHLGRLLSRRDRFLLTLDDLLVCGVDRIE